MTLAETRIRPERITLLALDIDDTLTGDDGRVSTANREAVAWARASGVMVTLVTGRRYLESAQRFAAELEISGPIGCHFGRAIVAHPTGEFLSEHYLPADIAPRLLDLARDWQLSPSVCADETIFFPESPAYGQRPSAQSLSMTRVELVPDLDHVLDTYGSRLMSMSLSGPNAARVREVFAPEVAAGRLTVYDQRATGRGERLAVMLGGQESKGTALRAICARLQIPVAEVVAMGDSEADIPLLRAAGYGIAMPWADEHVRQAADHVACGDADDAVARQLFRLLG